VKLAVAADMNPATLNRIEQGKANPNLKTLEKLAAAMGVEVADFFPKAPRRSSLEPSLFNGLEEERRLHYLKPWIGHINGLANRVGPLIDQGLVADLNWWQAFNLDVLALTLQYNQILPSPEDQTEAERLELLKLSEAIDRLNEVADKMDRAIEPVLADQRRERYAKERERRKAAFNAIPRRRSA